MSMKDLSAVTFALQRPWLPFLGLIGVAAVSSNLHWLDATGNRIEAHAAGFLWSPQNERWYMYGESIKDRVPNPHGGVNCYSADTLAGPWLWEGEALMQHDIVVEGKQGPWIVERPKVLYNNATGKYVMWFHLDIPSSWNPAAFMRIRGLSKLSRYIFMRAAVAVADTPTGPFNFVSAFKPDGIPSLDLNVFQDPLDGQAYLLRDCGHMFVGISRLSWDFKNTTGIISKIPTSEGMAMLRMKNGTYYVLSSHLSGWDPNPMILWRSNSTNISNTAWEDLGNPTGHDTSFDSQPTSVVPYTTASGEHYFIYMGDNWVRCQEDPGKAGNLTTQILDACYVWLPFWLGAGPLQIKYRENWDLEDPQASPAVEKLGYREEIMKVIAPPAQNPAQLEEHMQDLDGQPPVERPAQIEEHMQESPQAAKPAQIEEHMKAPEEPQKDEKANQQEPNKAPEEPQKDEKAQHEEPKKAPEEPQKDEKAQHEEPKKAPKEPQKDEKAHHEEPKKAPKEPQKDEKAHQEFSKKAPKEPQKDEKAHHEEPKKDFEQVLRDAAGVWTAAEGEEKKHKRHAEEDKQAEPIDEGIRGRLRKMREKPRRRFRFW